MKTVALMAYPRTLERRGGSKKLRASGRVPAVIYGRHAAPQNLEINRKVISDMLAHASGEALLLDLAVDGDQRAKRLALLREVQHHPLSGIVLHVDFQEIVETERVTVQVPVETTGEAAGVKEGGVLEHVLFKVKVRGLPKDLPEQVIIDVTALNIGQAVHIGDIQPPPGVEILGDKHISVVAVAAPLTEEQEAAATAAESTTAGEVEMIKEKKEDGTEGAEGEKGAAKPAAGAKGAADKAPAAGAKAPAAGGKAPAEKAPAAEKKK